MDSQLDARSTIVDLHQPLPETSAMALDAFCTDVARKIHDSATIADRYRFRDVDHMKSWLNTHQAVIHKIQETKAGWDADTNIDVKCRTLAGFATAEAIPSITQIALDPTIAPGLRNDAFKELARVAGVSGPPPMARDASGNTGTPAGRFSVQIVFASEGRVESFTTREPPTIEPEEEPT